MGRREQSEIYSMSFTTGALLYREAEQVARLFEKLQNWNEVRRQVIDNNLLQMRSANASQRVFREVASRLKKLDPEILTHFTQVLRHEQQYILWLAICQRYSFISDFAIEVLRERYLRQEQLIVEDFDRFFDDKAAWHPEVGRVSPATRKKLKWALFKMLKEADLITEDLRITPALLSPRLIDLIKSKASSYMAAFPVVISV